MNEVLYLGCLWIFLLQPIVLLGLRWARPRLMPWWLLLVVIALTGWPLANGAAHFYYLSLDDLMLSYGDHPPEALVGIRVADGAKMIFALLFGWLYGLVYLLPWLCLYGILQLGRRLLAARQRFLAALATLLAHL